MLPMGWAPKGLGAQLGYYVSHSIPHELEMMCLLMSFLFLFLKKNNFIDSN